LLSKGHFSVYEVARVIIHSEARSPELIAWLHQFAVDPKQKYLDDVDARRTVEPVPP